MSIRHIIGLAAVAGVGFGLMASTAMAETDALAPRAPKSAVTMKNPTMKNDVAAGKVIFTELCSACHGDTGVGDGRSAELLDPKPRDFTSKVWQKTRTDGEIFWLIQNGSKHTKMEGFGQSKLDLYSDTEMWSLVNYIRSLAK
ncbi:MAG: cytochrome c class I [Alphaproteobacteria bacterium CG_4_10_14_0_2_um_filter_63_37]|nr:MAG: hypothetical protein AUJ55_05825 [Proteobacteria bacterium CG1_02_64_396]PJA25424.1 MAG: cytochrome c class I [Alphaproteobacteria bacterium CG_4_10_14_0_2_um_filter_63_37]